MESSETQLRRLEERLQRTVTHSDAVEVEFLLAPGFVEFGSSGRVWTSKEMIDALASEGPVEVHMSAFAVREPATGLALVTYRARVVRPGQAPAHSLRSSLWQRDGEHWRILFHQATPTVAEPA